MMPASEHETAGVLSSAEIQQFIQDGFVRIDRAFPRQLADEGRALLWRDLPCDPDDPASWTRPVIRLGYYDHEPFRRRRIALSSGRPMTSSSAKGARAHARTPE